MSYEVIRRGLRGLLAAIAIAAFAAIQSGPATAGPALVFDVRSGEVLHAHEPFQAWYPASLTKMMTAYVTFQAIRQGRFRLDSPVRVSQFALSQPPSKMGFPVGTELSLDYALRILMVRSANDIAVAIAETIGGGHDAFIRDMNAAAARIGMTDTRFVNPHGLPDQRQVTTARDLGLLVRALIVEFPEHQGFFQTQAVTVGQKVLANHNKLIGRFQGADGMKTGYICSSGFNLAASATRRGRRLVAIVLGAPNAAYREEVAAGLLEAGFSQGSRFKLLGRRGTTITGLPRPATIPAPVDLRPYVCDQKKKMPDHLASFGIGPVTARASTNAAVPGIPGLSFAPTAGDADPLAELSVPLPRPRPRPAAGGNN